LDLFSWYQLCQTIRSTAVQSGGPVEWQKFAGEWVKNCFIFRNLAVTDKGTARNPILQRDRVSGLGLFPNVSYRSSDKDHLVLPMVVQN
jgi:hypothetical protein